MLSVSTNSNGVWRLQASIDVLRQEVDDYYGADGFWCECYAWNSATSSSSDVMNSAPRSAKSRRTVIQAACTYLYITPCSHFSSLRQPIRYLTNRFSKFHQIYDFDAVGDQCRRHTRERKVTWPGWKIHRPGSSPGSSPGSALPTPAYYFTSVIVWTENKNVTISDRFICFILSLAVCVLRATAKKGRHF